MTSTTRTDQVINKLRTMLLSGELAPGTHLTEANMAQHLSVSRTPVRDALRVLANEKLLNYSPNRGYVVRTFALQDILDAYDVRATLEAMACRLAAERGLDPMADLEFDQIIERSTQLLSGPQWELAEHKAWRDLNQAFHYRLLGVAGNQHLTEMAMLMRRQPRLQDPRLEPATSTFQTIYPLERARRSHEEHQEILAAVRQRQGTRAEGLMREHVWRNREALRRLLPHMPVAQEAADQ